MLTNIFMAFMILFYIALSIHFLLEKPQFSPKKHTMRIPNISLSVLAALVLFSCSKIELADKQLIPLLELSSGKAPLYANEANAKYIPGEYIVVFKDDVDVDIEVEKSEKIAGFKAKHLYKHALKGFAASLPIQAIEVLRNNPKVLFIEQDQQVEAISITQSNPTWGLDRIDQSGNALDNTYTYPNAGELVDVYVIDTGILFGHLEFENRALKGIDVISKRGTGSDGNGHGTHVAATIGGKTYGVAKKVKLYAVRVLDNRGSGTTSGVIAGVDWVTSHHQPNKPAVANMSLGGSVSTSLDAAVLNSIKDGIVYCVAAGNSNANAINSSPARVKEAITVGATDKNDFAATYSNFGDVIDINAPGTDITSAWNTSTNSIKTISGTSMASPHVAGAAAIYLRSINLILTPDQVRDALVSSSTKNVLTLSFLTYNKIGTPNNLLFVSNN